MSRLDRPSRGIARAPIALLSTAIALLAGCGAGEGPPEPASRDWQAHPAVVEMPAVDVLYAISDVHGGYERAVTLLVANGILAGAPSDPSAPSWAAGQATLVVIGDMFDKGPDGLEVIDLFRALEPAAEAAGGRVITLMGNHEADFLADPENSRASRADGIGQEIRDRGLRPYDVASRADPRGRFLHDLPFAARVGDWFFLHSGNTGGRTLPELSSMIEGAIEARGYGAEEIVGPESILDANGWFRSGDAIGQSYAEVLGVRHIVFGHDPAGYGDDKRAIFAGAGGALFRVDCGLSPNIDYSDGKLLQVSRAMGKETAVSLDEMKISTTLWSGDL